VTQQAGIADQITQSLIHVNADGTNRTVLLEGSNATAPRFSPDGTQLAFGVVTDASTPAQSLKGGVFDYRTENLY
jgi:Tol biopolymer transport system component